MEETRAQKRGAHTQISVFAMESRIDARAESSGAADPAGSHRITKNCRKCALAAANSAGIRAEMGGLRPGTAMVTNCRSTRERWTIPRSGCSTGGAPGPNCLPLRRKAALHFVLDKMAATAKAPGTGGGPSSAEMISRWELAFVAIPKRSFP